MNARNRSRGEPAGALFDFTAPLTIPGAGVAGAEIVRELPAEIALAAWQALRSVLLWASEPPGERDDVFEPGAMREWEHELLLGSFDAGLRCPLAVVVGELARGDQAGPEQVAWGCVCVTEWGLDHKAVATALAFAEAAALAWPDHPRYAWLAGRLLRAHGKPREAEVWLRRTIRVAARAGDWEAQARALMALGNLFIERGNFPEARALHTQALRVARRRRLREYEALALHELFVVATATNELRQAEEYGQLAFEAYGANHPLVPALAHDIAFHWMKLGDFGSALVVLSVIQSHFKEPGERIRVIANTARAAAACGVRDVYERFCSEARKLADEVEKTPTLASAMVQLALGASSMREWRLAEQMLNRAVEVGRQVGETDAVYRAETMLEKIRMGEPAEGVATHNLAGKQPRASAFANQMVSALQAA